MYATLIFYILNSYAEPMFYISWLMMLIPHTLSVNEDQEQGPAILLDIMSLTVEIMHLVLS